MSVLISLSVLGTIGGELLLRREYPFGSNLIILDCTRSATRLGKLVSKLHGKSTTSLRITVVRVKGPLLYLRVPVIYVVSECRRSSPRPETGIRQPQPNPNGEGGSRKGLGRQEWGRGTTATEIRVATGSSLEHTPSSCPPPPTSPVDLRPSVGR